MAHLIPAPTSRRYPLMVSGPGLGRRSCPLRRPAAPQVMDLRIASEEGAAPLLARAPAPHTTRRSPSAASEFGRGPQTCPRLCSRLMLQQVLTSIILLVRIVILLAAVCIHLTLPIFRLTELALGP